MRSVGVTTACICTNKNNKLTLVLTMKRIALWNTLNSNKGTNFDMMKFSVRVTKNYAKATMDFLYFQHGMLISTSASSFKLFTEVAYFSKTLAFELLI